MKTVLKIACALVFALALAIPATAYETDFNDLREFNRDLPGWKLGRGFVNMMSGPHELTTHITNNSIKGAYNGSYGSGFHGYLAGSTTGAIAGVWPGLKHGLRRMTLGALEVITFWKPEYGPTMDPTYGSRNMAFGESDYFDPNPFWYNGPPR